jgi:hypothetical protein
MERLEGKVVNCLKLLGMLTKKVVLDVIDTLPQEFDAKDAIEKILLIDKIDIGLRQSDEGKVISFDEAKTRLAKWLR